MLSPLQSSFCHLSVPPRWSTWMSWPGPWRASAVLRSEASARCWSPRSLSFCSLCCWGGTDSYTGKFEIIDDHRARKIMNPLGRLNKCGVISPRFDVQLKDIEKWQNNLLPSCQFGLNPLTVSAGIMDHEKSKPKTHRRKNLRILYLRV